MRTSVADPTVPGPATHPTTLYTGQVVFNATPSGDFTVLDTHGTSRDLCAELDG